MFTPNSVVFGETLVGVCVGLVSGGLHFKFGLAKWDCLNLVLNAVFVMNHRGLVTIEKESLHSVCL